MHTTVPTSTFIALAKKLPIIDVRAPQEFMHGHIPGAHNIPLFSNAGWAVVSTAHKEGGRDNALLAGMELLGPRLRELIVQVTEIAQNNNTKTLLIHCWRGGMRSASFAWLLHMFGYHVYVLDGGYKAFRATMRSALETQKNVILVGGKTGAGKTHIIRSLASHNEQTMDLEIIARHKGTVFGSLGESEQPTQEQFENILGLAWLEFDGQKSLWIEDKRRKIGSLIIPEALWLQMQQAQVFCVEIAWKKRIENLQKDYRHYDSHVIMHHVMKLQKQLGGVRAQEICAQMREEQTEAACYLLLDYYDRAYEYTLSKRASGSVLYVPLHATDQTIQALELKNFYVHHRQITQWLRPTAHL